MIAPCGGHLTYEAVEGIVGSGDGPSQGVGGGQEVPHGIVLEGDHVARGVRLGERGVGTEGAGLATPEHWECPDATSGITGPHAALPEENFGGRPGCGVLRNPAGRRFFDPLSSPLTPGDLMDESPWGRIFGTYH